MIRQRKGYATNDKKLNKSAVDDNKLAVFNVGFIVSNFSFIN